VISLTQRRMTKAYPGVMPSPVIDSSIASVFLETLLCYVCQTENVKILSAIPGAASMNKEEVHKFLESKLLLQIGTIDDEGDPNIQPVWFDYDKYRDKLLIITPKASKKVRTLRSKPNVYFSIDDENFPYKGVKGKGTATIIEDPERTVPLGEKINMKYLGTLDHPIPMMILDSAKKGNHVVVEISPKFFSTWDFAKMQ
jgi:nitroimidazol reductase NimA-like FMN-containing flavoprotein (pyridoxamine 5'-phosphate oxidase superfamily)